MATKASACYTAAPPKGRPFLFWLVCLCATASLPAAGGVDWTLRGTVVLEGESGYAIVEQVGRPEQVWLRTGDEILPGMRLTAVFRDHAIVSRAGRSRRIDFGGRLDGADAATGADRYTIDPGRLPEIVAAIDLIPHQQHGRIDGYYANKIPRTLRQEIGLRPGDLVRRVNGRRLDGGFAPSALQGLLQDGRLEIEVVRRGHPVELVYELGTGHGGN